MLVGCACPGWLVWLVSINIELQESQALKELSIASFVRVYPTVADPLFVNDRCCVAESTYQVSQLSCYPM